MFFDPLWFVFAVPGLLLMLWAQAKTKSAYAKYSQVPNMVGLQGWQVARRILDSNGLQDVQIEETPGELSDHYDPTTRILRLSPGVGRTASVAALGIAAHEVGHAIQHARGYVPMKARGGLVPVVNIGSTLGQVALMAGIVLQIAGLAWVGVILFSFATIFALVTLPVEFDASSRAMSSLRSVGLVSGGDYDGAKAVLDAAAWTYVAGFVTVFFQLIYFVMQAVGISRRSD